MKIDDTDEIDTGILQGGMKNGFIINIMNDRFLISFWVYFPHLKSELVHSYKINTENDDEAEHVLDEDWINVDAGVWLWSEALEGDESGLLRVHFIGLWENWWSRMFCRVWGARVRKSYANV